MGGTLLLGELQIGEASADEHHGTTKQLADRLTKIVLDIGPRLRIANCEPQTIHLSPWQSPPEPPSAKSNDRSHAREQPGPPEDQQRPQSPRAGIGSDSASKGAENYQDRADKTP